MGGVSWAGPGTVGVGVVAAGADAGATLGCTGCGANGGPLFRARVRSVAEGGDGAT